MSFFNVSALFLSFKPLKLGNISYTAGFLCEFYCSINSAVWSVKGEYDVGRVA